MQGPVRPAAPFSRAVDYCILTAQSGSVSPMSPLALDLRSYPHEARAHDHPHHQVILALEGELDMEIGRRSGRVAATHGALVPAGTMHAFAGIGRNRIVLLDIAAACAEEPRALLTRETPFFAVPRAVEHLLGYMQVRADSLAAEMEHVAPLLAGALPGFCVVGV